MDRPPFTELVPASEFQHIPGIYPELPINTPFDNTPGPHENTTMVATDGKKDDPTGRWGVGMTDLNPRSRPLHGWIVLRP